MPVLILEIAKLVMSGVPEILELFRNLATDNRIPTNAELDLIHKHLADARARDMLARARFDATP